MRFVTLIAAVLLLSACSTSPGTTVEPAPPPKPVIKIIAAKLNPTESGSSLRVGFSLSGKVHLTPVATTCTVYYVVFTDGTKMEVPMEEWALVNVGDKKAVQP